jgi:hypothetical protein
MWDGEAGQAGNATDHGNGRIGSIRKIALFGPSPVWASVVSL